MKVKLPQSWRNREQAGLGGKLAAMSAYIGKEERLKINMGASMLENKRRKTRVSLKQMGENK